MDVVYERCAGLDIHRDTVVAGVITREGRELQTFGTVTDELLALADWLLGLGVTIGRPISCTWSLLAACAR